MRAAAQRHIRFKGAILNSLGSALLNALFPARCAGCEQFRSPPQTLAEVLERVSALLNRVPQNQAPGSFSESGIHGQAHNAARSVLANWFCPTCRESFTWISSPYCTVCGRIFPSRSGHDHPCAACTRTPPPFDRARACGMYGGSLKAVIQKLKYHGQVQWADPLGLLLYLAARNHGFLKDCDVILPVPLHPSRLRHRGFNQVYLMLRQWPNYARRLDAACRLPIINPWRLHRRRPTIPQTGLAPKDRRANVRGAFQIEDPQGIIKGRQILLVDDVFTTGATSGACVQALKSKGRAAGVHVLTLASTT